MLRWGGGGIELIGEKAVPVTIFSATNPIRSGLRLKEACELIIHFRCSWLCSGKPEMGTVHT